MKMVDNTARALDPQTTLQPQQNPKQAPKKQAAPSVQVQPQKHVAFSPVERLLVCAIGVAVTAIAILCLFAHARKDQSNFDADRYISAIRQ
jgi:cell division protein FtsL